MCPRTDRRPKQWSSIRDKQLYTKAFCASEVTSMHFANFAMRLRIGWPSLQLRCPGYYHAPNLPVVQRQNLFGRLHRRPMVAALAAPLVEQSGLGRNQGLL